MARLKLSEHDSRYFGGAGGGIIVAEHGCMPHTLRHLLLISAITTSAGVLGACAGEEEFAPDTSRADETCQTSLEIIAEARKQVDASGDGSIVPIADINDDGVADMLVLAGSPDSSGNAKTTVFLANCPVTYLGDVGEATGVKAIASKTKGMLDLESTTAEGCRGKIATYQYDGQRYVHNESLNRTEDICTPEPIDPTDLAVPAGCASDAADLIVDARVRLQGSEEVFDDDLAKVSTIEDLNGDGFVDFIVEPGFSYSVDGIAAPNVDKTIYLSDQDGCATSFAGSFGGTSELYVTADQVTTSGVRDVRTVSILSCNGYIHRYKYDGTTYQIDDLEIVKVEGCTP